MCLGFYKKKWDENQGNAKIGGNLLIYKECHWAEMLLWPQKQN